MYKPSVKRIETNYKDLFDESKFYRCREDVHCNDGVFDKNSLVKIKNLVVSRGDSDVKEDYICLYDMDSCMQNSPPSLHTESFDIPLGVTERNFEGLFEEADEFSNDIADICKSYYSKRFIMKLISHIKNFLIVIGALAAGVLMIYVLYEYLFSKDSNSLSAYLRLFIPVGIVFGICLLTAITSSFLSKRFTKQYHTSLKDAYKNYQIDAAVKTDEPLSDETKQTSDNAKPNTDPV